MPGGQLHVLIFKHSPFLMYLGQKYGPKSLQMKRMGQVARLTSQVFTNSLYCGGSSLGNCNCSSGLSEPELFTSARRALTVFLSASSPKICRKSKFFILRSKIFEKMDFEIFFLKLYYVCGGLVLMRSHPSVIVIAAY